ncbi:Uncharacterised protein [Escherichia coli]|nr:Uncharacterised protein [Escherichia coli]
MLCACLFTTSGSVVSWSSYTAKKDKIMSTAFYSAIFKAHIATIHSVRDIPQMGAVSQDELHKVKNRAILLTTLDVMLAIHRQEHGTIFSPLKGKSAIIHLLNKTYSWPGEQIRKMDLEDVIIAVQHHLVLEKLPQSYRGFLDKIHANVWESSFDDFINGEWNPDHSKEYSYMLVE